ncbi:type III glutamate--ammonia ligase [uncultured Jatrophihabitans sp.]|uniref:type III glutamate--ammonia ligase n=1 Tax=uncultured Jatrophihabitans sp. TaxID=1610747 RepID=UPI0035CBE79F
MTDSRSVLDEIRPAAVAPAASQTLQELAEADGTKHLLAIFTTLTGKPCAKLVPVRAADMLQFEGVGFAGFAAGALGQAPRDPDVMAIPDLSTYTPLPFVRPGLALVHCDAQVDGAIHPFAPRNILRAMINRAAGYGLQVRAGAETEYFLLRREADGTLVVADDRDDAAQPCYDVRGVTRMFDHLSAVTDAMDAMGWEPYASDHEDGNGQFEQNFTYSDVLTTADRVTTLRYVIHMLAEQRGMLATFMPKPFTNRTGTGLHLHLSLWRDGEPVCPDSSDRHGLGLSAEAYSFLAGILEHAPGLHALIAPTVNSYKRTGASTTSSGATWAPPRVASYGGNDRTHFLRVPDGNRFELRGADGSADPYLAAAAVIAAGLDGLERGLDPGAPGSSDGPALPRTLLDAVHAFENDTVLTGALDALDPSAGVAAYYANLKREEFYTWHSQVTPWELEHYLTAV